MITNFERGEFIRFLDPLLDVEGGCTRGSIVQESFENVELALGQTDDLIATLNADGVTPEICIANDPLSCY